MLIVSLLFMAVPAVSAWADEGSVELGLSVRQEGSGFAVDDTQGSSAAGSMAGSVDLGLAVGGTLESGSSPVNSASGAVELGIALDLPRECEVAFVGYYAADDGTIASGAHMLGTARAAAGQALRAPESASRTYTEGGNVIEYFLDGWYTTDPATWEGGAPPAGDVAQASPVAAGPQTLYCVWRRGYVVRFDANNGTANFASASGGTLSGDEVFRGELDGSPYVSVTRTPEWDADPTAEDAPSVTLDQVPTATRPGYRFCGWYWAQEGESGVKQDGYGCAMLDDGSGSGAVKEPVVPTAPAEGGSPEDTVVFTYEQMSSDECNGRTLYAKWELDPDAVVRISLSGVHALGEDGVTRPINLWLWEGRGFTLDKPAQDCEVKAVAAKDVEDAHFLFTSREQIGQGADVSAKLVSLGLATNPPLPTATQVFSGWGYHEQDASSLEDVVLVGCGRASAEAASFTYTLRPEVFNYVDEGALTWRRDAKELAPRGDGDDPADAGWSWKCSWDALFDSAHISVTAPIEVVFQRSGTDGTDDSAYTASDLDSTRGAAHEWVESTAQEFTNMSYAGSEEAGNRKNVDVYVSSVTCVNMSAASLFTAKEGSDLRVFSLYENAVLGGGAIGDRGDWAAKNPTAMTFGYDTERDANVAVRPAYVSGRCIEIPYHLPEGDGGQEKKKTLYFGFDLTKVLVNRDAIRVGVPGEGAANAYTTDLANVKYTYSVVP